MSKTHAASHAHAGRSFPIVVVLLINGLVFFYVAFSLVDSIVAQFHLSSMEQMFVYSAYFIPITLSAFVGSIVQKRVGRINLLRLWVILGIAAGLFALLADEPILPLIVAASAFLGFSFGLGMPSCLSCFVNLTSFENRGFFSGLIFMTTSLIVPGFVLIRSANFVLNCLTSTIWKSIGLLVFFMKPTEENHSPVSANEKSLRQILFHRSFLLYFIAWLMFCFVERVETPLIDDLFGGFSTIALAVAPLIGGVSALVAGTLSDHIGRKKIILACFSMFGVAYAVIGFAPHSIFSWYLYLGTYSITSGALWMIFIFIIWGELASTRGLEKYFALGEAPYFLALLAQLLLTPFVLEVEKISMFSLAAFFLFLAVIPLIYAPETVPEKKIRERELKEYIDKAKKAKEKYTQESGFPSRRGKIDVLSCDVNDGL